MYPTCCEFNARKNRKQFPCFCGSGAVTPDKRIKRSAGSRSQSISQTRVQLEWVRSHRAVIQLVIATALTRATLAFTTEINFVYQSLYPPFFKPVSRIFLPCVGCPRPINCFGLAQFSKRRSTSAINFISAIKVPTPDLVWPAQPRSPDFWVWS